MDSEVQEGEPPTFASPFGIAISGIGAMLNFEPYGQSDIAQESEAWLSTKPEHIGRSNWNDRRMHGIAVAKRDRSGDANRYVSRL